METFKKVLKEWIIPFGLEIIAVILIVKFVFFFAVVPTSSMVPTVDMGSWLFATRVYNPKESVKRGDIIVFRSDELDQTLLKRCVGLPGEHIEVRGDGGVYIDGEYYDEPYVVFPSGDTAAFTVPEGCFVFLGDNREGSLDARYWKEPYIPAEKVMGKAHFTLWPLKNFGPLK